jgi:hypothetical protein
MNQRIPQGIDVNTPNVARVYDYMLGGKDNFAADREAAERIAKAFPEARDGVRHNREFLGNAVAHLAGEVGLRQFVDIGAGLPTQQNVHEVARSVAPDSRTVYIDNDPIVCVHGRALLADDPSVAIVQGDLRHPAELVNQVAESGLINCAEPVGVLMVAVLHFLEDPYEQVAQIREMVPSGSHLVITHLTMTDDRAKDTATVREVYSRASSNVIPRPIPEIKRFFGDFEPLDVTAFFSPGIQRSFGMLGWGGMARKP